MNREIKFRAWSKTEKKMLEMYFTIGGAFRLYFKGDLLCNEPYEIEDIGFYDLNNYQIIGNIFENPELLT